MVRPDGCEGDGWGGRVADDPRGIVCGWTRRG